MSAFIILASYDSQTTAAWLAAWGTWFAAIGTVGVALVAFFPEMVRGLILRPKCLLECGKSDIFWHQLTNPRTHTKYRQIRLRVFNIGNAPVREIEVHLLNVSKFHGTVCKAVPGFVPVRLKWTHGGPLTKSFLAPETGALIDFGTIGPAIGVPGSGRYALLSLNVEVERTNLWDYGGGTYHFDIGVGSSTGFIKRMIFEVSFEKQWFTMTDKLEVHEANFSIKPLHVIACGCESPC